APDLDVGRNEIEDFGGSSSSKHHVHGRRLKIVVDNLKRPRPIPAYDRRRVSPAELVNVRHVGVNDRRPGAVHHDSASGAGRGGTVDVAAVKDDIGRHLTERLLDFVEGAGVVGLELLLIVYQRSFRDLGDLNTHKPI